MEIKNMIRELEVASKVISIRIYEEDYNFMRENNLQPSKVIGEALRELRNPDTNSQSPTKENKQ